MSLIVHFKSYNSKAFPCEPARPHDKTPTDDSPPDSQSTHLTQNADCLNKVSMPCLPCECWSRGLGGGPIPLCPPCLIVRPFIWLKRLSSLKLFSWMPSIGYEVKNQTVWRWNHVGKWLGCPNVLFLFDFYWDGFVDTGGGWLCFHINHKIYCYSKRK